MHIIVSILKIAGISAIFIVLLLVFLLILLLVVPFSYRIYGSISEQGKLDKSKRNVEAKVTVQFLAFLLMVSLEYTEEGWKGVLRILGIPIKRIGGKKTQNIKQKKQKEQKEEEILEKEKLEKKQKEKENLEKEKKEKKQKESEREKEQKQKEQKDVTQNDIEQNDSKQEQEVHKEEDSRFLQIKNKFCHVFYRLVHIPKHSFDILREYRLHIKSVWKRFCITKEKIIDAYNNEHVRNGISIIWKQCKHGCKHLLPRSVFLRLHFGCSDPAVTGQILGILSILYAFYGDTVQIKPEFDQTILEGEAELKGHISLSLLGKIAWILYRNKEVRYVMKRIKAIKD